MILLDLDAALREPDPSTEEQPEPFQPHLAVSKVFAELRPLHRQLARIAKRIVVSNNAFSIMVPILDQLLHWKAADIRELFETYGLTLNEWERERTDRVHISEMRAFNSCATAAAQ